MLSILVPATMKQYSVMSYLYLLYMGQPGPMLSGCMSMLVEKPDVEHVLAR